MYRSIVLSAWLILAGHEFAVGEVQQWDSSRLTDQTIEAIQQQTLNYHRCLDRQMAAFNQKDFDSRTASNSVLKQCEDQLDPIRSSLLNEHVPIEIANRYLLRKRHEAARQVLKFMMFAESQQNGH